MTSKKIIKKIEKSAFKYETVV